MADHTTATALVVAIVIVEARLDRFLHCAQNVRTRARAHARTSARTDRIVT